MKECDEGLQGLIVVPKRVEPEYARPVDRSLIGYGATVRVSGGRRFNRTFTIDKDADADISSGKVGMEREIAWCGNARPATFEGGVRA